MPVLSPLFDLVDGVEAAAEAHSLRLGELLEPGLEDGAPAEHRGAHEHHPVPGDCGRGRVVDVVGLEHNLHTPHKHIQMSLRFIQTVGDVRGNYGEEVFSEAGPRPQWRGFMLHYKGGIQKTCQYLNKSTIISNNCVRTEDLAAGSHRDPVSVRQGQSFVVVQNRVQVFNPNGINWTVQNNPDVFTLRQKHRLHISPGLVLV